jgi:hypothetical protein
MGMTASEKTAIAEEIAYNIWHYDQPNEWAVEVARGYVNQVLFAMETVRRK